MPPEARVLTAPGDRCEAGDILATWWRLDHEAPPATTPPDVQELLNPYRSRTRPEGLDADHLGRLIKLLGDHGHLHWATPHERDALHRSSPDRSPVWAHRTDSALHLNDTLCGPDAHWAYWRAAFRFRRGLAVLRGLRPHR